MSTLLILLGNLKRGVLVEKRPFKVSYDSYKFFCKTGGHSSFLFKDGMELIVVNYINNQYIIAEGFYTGLIISRDETSFLSSGQIRVL